MARPSTFPAPLAARHLQLVCAMCLLALRGALACSPPEGGYVLPLLEEKVRDSDAVVAGIPVRRMPDNNYDSAYSVEFQVYCVFKGKAISQRIHIENVGSIPGLCISTNLTQGERYIVFLSKVSGRDSYMPEFEEQPGIKAYLDELPDVCEVEITLPKGMTQDDPNFRCPQPRQYPEDCLHPPTEGTPPEPPTVKTPPPPPGSDHEAPPPSSDQRGRPRARENTPGGESGASYESVVEESEKGGGGDGDKDSATHLRLSWALILIFCSIYYSFFN